jgi:hypothetical protein
LERNEPSARQLGREIADDIKAESVSIAGKVGDVYELRFTFLEDGEKSLKAGRVLAARNVTRITGAVQALAEALSEVGVIIKVEAQAAAEAPADDADEPKAGKAAGPNPQGSPTTTDEERLRLIEVGIAELDLL